MFAHIGFGLHVADTGCVCASELLSYDGKKHAASFIAVGPHVHSVSHTLAARVFLTSVMSPAVQHQPTIAANLARALASDVLRDHTTTVVVTSSVVDARPPTRCDGRVCI